MNTIVPGWTTLSQDPPVLVREYAFGSGHANAMAVMLPEKRWLIMSPPNRLAPDEAQAFEAAGQVVALIENNGSHHLGLGPCRKAFPRAVTYAAPRAAARIRKKGRDYGELEPIEKLAALLGDKVSVVEVPGDKIGDVLLHVKTEHGNLVYAGDFFANIQKLPRNLLFRLAFQLSDSGPGLKVFNLFFRFFARDPAEMRKFIARQLELIKPAILVPAHGDVVQRADLGATLVSMLQAA
jgi:hypothetical protein